METESEDNAVRVQIWGRKMEIVFSEEQATRLRHLGRTVLREPFTKRAWSELLFLAIGVPLAALGAAFVGILLASGVVFAVTFVGFFLIALSVRGSRGFGRWHRSLARSLIGEDIAEPSAFIRRPGVLGWLQSALRDRVGWRSIAYIAVKVPLAFFSVLTALAVWICAFTFITSPFSGHSSPGAFGLPRLFLRSNFYTNGGYGFFHGLGTFITGLFLLAAAPWVVRGVIYVDRYFMRLLLAPDSVALRLQSLESARAQTVDASAATLRRIERDLHDGTQAQLVALAMRLGMVKEKLADDDLDLDQVRLLVDDAHRGAKEAITELRDLARGIHPPALDTGLEGALATLAARSTVPAELTLSIHDRPTPSIEAIAYFCVAELLANVAQHAHASRASISCAQHGEWLRVVVRDDGMGGAELSTMGSTSSGLSGLTDRVHAVDGQLHIASPLRGPTVVTVDLPLHA
jgi:signal transduction histidine kinase